MTFFIVIAVLLAIAALAPFFGTDSRNLRTTRGSSLRQ